jgi:hypothetical protein
MLRSRVSDVIHKQGCEQDQDEDATHTFYGLHAHVFDVQSVFLVKAVCVLNQWAKAPLGVHGFSIAVGWPNIWPWSWAR